MNEVASIQKLSLPKPNVIFKFLPSCVINNSFDFHRSVSGFAKESLRHTLRAVRDRWCVFGIECNFANFMTWAHLGLRPVIAQDREIPVGSHNLGGAGHRDYQ